MSLFLILLFVVIIFLGMVIPKLPCSGVSAGKSPFIRKSKFLNQGEQDLFNLLREVMTGHHVFTQVRLADIVEVGNNCKDRQFWFNKISRKSVDFVICDKSFSVVACIELDGKSHERTVRQKADGQKDDALHSAGIPIIRIDVGKVPSPEFLFILIEQAKERVAAT